MEQKEKESTTLQQIADILKIQDHEAPELHSAILTQDKIGWDQITRGRIAQHWEQLGTKHWSSEISGNWTTGFIK